MAAVARPGHVSELALGIDLAVVVGVDAGPLGMIQGVERLGPQLQLVTFSPEREGLIQRDVPVVDSRPDQVVATLVSAMQGEILDALRVVRRVGTRFHVAVRVELADEGTTSAREVAVTTAVSYIAHEIVGA